MADARSLQWSGWWHLTIYTRQLGLGWSGVGDGRWVGIRWVAHPASKLARAGFEYEKEKKNMFNFFIVYPLV